MDINKLAIMSESLDLYDLVNALVERANGEICSVNKKFNRENYDFENFLDFCVKGEVNDVDYLLFFTSEFQFTEERMVAHVVSTFPVYKTRSWTIEPDEYFAIARDIWYFIVDLSPDCCLPKNLPDTRDNFYKQIAYFINFEESEVTLYSTIDTSEGEEKKFEMFYTFDAVKSLDSLVDRMIINEEISPKTRAAHEIRCMLCSRNGLSMLKDRVESINNYINTHSPA